MSTPAAAIKNWLKAGRSTLLLRVALGGLFLLAAAAKFQNLNLFFASLLELRLSDANTAFVLSRALPAIEALAGLWLILGWKPFAAAVFGGGLTLLFTLVLLSAWLRGIQVECFCFGTLPLGATPGAAILRNLLLLAIFGWLAWRCWCQAQRVQTH